MYIECGICEGILSLNIYLLFVCPKMPFFDYVNRLGTKTEILRHRGLYAFQSRS